MHKDFNLYRTLNYAAPKIKQVYFKENKVNKKKTCIYICLYKIKMVIS